MAETFTHEGPLLALPPSASPGLQFLKHLLPVLDSLNPDGEALALSAVLAPGATFTINNDPPATAEQVLAQLLLRSQKLSHFGHEVHRVWDVGKGGPAGFGGRTVMYESTSTTVFRDDPAGRKVTVQEFGIVELVPVAEGEGGFAGLKAVDLKAFMDPAPVRAHAVALFGGGSGQAQS